MSVSVALLAVRLLAQAGKGLIIVMDGDHRAEALVRLLSQLSLDANCHWFPAWDCLPYDRAAPSPDIMGRRMQVLRDLAAKPEAAIIVTTPEALVQRFPARRLLPDPVVVERGTLLDLEAFGIACSRLGYTHADRVDDPGHIAIRGEVIDIFPAARRPSRIVILDGKIESLHCYDPGSQRTTNEVTSIHIDPVSEVVLTGEDAAERFAGMEHWLPDFCAETETILDLLPDTMLTIEPSAANRLEQGFRQVAEAYEDRIAADKAAEDTPRKAVSPERHFMSAGEFRKRASKRLVDFPESEGSCEVPRFCLEDKPHKSVAVFVRERQDTSRRIVFSAARDRELAMLQREAERVTGVPPVRVERWDDLADLDPAAAALMKLSADRGFDDATCGVTLITAADLLGHHARVPSPRAVHVPWHLGDGEFAIGDFVIHLDHGMAVLQGIETVESGVGEGQEAVRLSYANGADLLVPVSEMDRVWRYGAETDDVALDKLDTEAWQKRRIKIAREVAETARSLVELAKQRKGMKAPKIVPARRDYERFVAGFPFAPTADQMHSIEDCLKDLASGRPMDRLVVGDVGFGKTEVALRAAAAAVLAGWQVAIVAPTTVLVRQHVQSFGKRFEQLGIEVAHLSRLVSAGESARVKAGLADGSIRLVVGTQALTSEDVVFDKLGLLIVDEEQRFGTADKAKLRARGADVHVLTLSATPIPRTLQSALVGLQELSVITTPPARRRPIRTLMTPFDPATIRATLLKEKARGGQSFVVIPRIEDLEPLSIRLTELMPGFDIRVGHGRMDAHEVDETMVAFAGGQGDVLLATSIIESGLDVPRANTMVVCEADRFGLAQLHQLRGRVGRGRAQGVCYLMTAPGQDMTPAAERRLSTLAKLDRLGSGMAISAQDLDARGAGDLMGEDQAGHMRLIGLGLYQHVLQQAINEASGAAADDWAPELNVGGSGAFPANYIPEAEVRLNLYARAARVADQHEIDDLAEEVEDRFGPIPDSAARLLAHARLKSLCRSRRIARIDAGAKAIALTPRPDMKQDTLLAQVSPRDGTTASIKNGRVLVQLAASGDAEQCLQMSAHLLETMSEAAE